MVSLVKQDELPLELEAQENTQSNKTINHTWY
jgi:hypothetical protein